MNDLRFIFTTPDKKILSSLTLLDGKLTVYMRSQSQQWQCRFKLSNGKWHSASCATTDLEAAKQQAIVLYETIKLKVDAELAIHVKTFGQIAREEITRLARIATTRQAERKYKDYLFILEKYLIPFFGNYKIADITDKVVAEFSAWRSAVMGKEAKAMTKKHHAMAFNRIVQIARERQYVYSNHTVPQLDITGAKSEPRPAFSNEEIQQLYAYTPIWQKDVIHKDSEAARILCTAYVKFLVNTGVRHSTESMPLRWKHLQWHYIGSKRYLRIWVSGKTGARYLIAKHEVIAVLEELLRWQQLPYRTLDEVIKAKLDRRIFVLPTGEMPHLLENIFRHLMIKSGLQKNAAGQNRTLYSLRHTYATEALAKGIDIHTLAKQMGTSVVMIEKHYSKLTAMMSAERLA
jgi:integrase